MAIEKKRPYHGKPSQLEIYIHVWGDKIDHKGAKRYNGLFGIKIKMGQNPQKHKLTLRAFTYSKKVVINLANNHISKAPQADKKQLKKAATLQTGHPERNRLHQPTLPTPDQPLHPPAILKNLTQPIRPLLKEAHQRGPVKEDARVHDPQEEAPARYKQERLYRPNAPPFPHQRNPDLLPGLNRVTETVPGGLPRSPA